MQIKKILLIIFSIIFFNYILIFSGTIKYIIFLNNLSKDALSNDQIYQKDLLVHNLTDDILYENQFYTKDITDLAGFLLITRDDLKNRNFRKIINENIKNFKISFPLLNQFSFFPSNNKNIKIIFKFSYLKLFWNISIKNY